MNQAIQTSARVSSAKSATKTDAKPAMDRQSQVLEAALKLLVNGGEKAITTAGVARAANCSKESIYKWFGDRDGMLAAMVEHQASKVSALGRPVGNESIRDHLVDFAANLLQVLSSDTSLAMNRLAIGASGNDRSKLGQHLLARGKKQISDRGGVILKRGKLSGELRYDDAQEAFETLYGLILRDQHIRLLLGEGGAIASPEARARATKAITQFYKLYGPVEHNNQNTQN